MKSNKIFIIVCVIMFILMSVFIFKIHNDKRQVEKELHDLSQSFDQLRESYCYVREELDNSKTIIQTLQGEEYIVGETVTINEIEMLAKTVYGEARGCSKLQQSAVVWCILNRVDSGQGTIAQVITAPNQFHGYSSSFPVTEEIKTLVEDVVGRWKLEKIGCGDVGRTLPSNYLYFSSDGTGKGNIFRADYRKNSETWNWDCWNPYS